jgi:hypothetical protein
MACTVDFKTVPAERTAWPFLDYLIQKHPIQRIPTLKVTLKKTKNKTPVTGWCQHDLTFNCLVIRIQLAESYDQLFLLQTVAHEYRHALQYDQGLLSNYEKNRVNCEIATDIWALNEVHEYLNESVENSRILDKKYKQSYLGISAYGFLNKMGSISAALNNLPAF